MGAALVHFAYVCYYYGMATQFKRGFTIVELLVVIVVLGILASVTVVAYNGVRERAIYSKLSAGLNAYEKAFRLYKAEHGEYPGVSGGAWGCFGRPEDYPAVDGFLAGQCGFSDDNVMINNQININTALKPYLPTIPDLSGLPVITYADGRKTRGVYYEGSQIYAYYEFGMKNNQKCPYGRDTWSGVEVLCNNSIYL